MRVLTISEFDMVAGGEGESTSAGDYVGAAAGAVCGAVVKGKAGAAACAVVGVAVADFIDASAGYVPTDPMDGKLGIN